MNNTSTLLLDMSMKEMNNKLGTGIRVNELKTSEQKNQMAAAVIKP